MELLHVAAVLLTVQVAQCLPSFSHNIRSPVNSIAFQQIEDFELHEKWDHFKLEYGKLYTRDEEDKKREIFRVNLEKIHKHNDDFEKGLTTYKMGINQYTDMYFEEASAMVNGYKPSNESWGDFATYLPPSVPVDIPTSLDWRTKGYVTAVKNQGGCGSCWAFSTTGTLEGQHFKQTGKLVSLSEQNLVDCSTQNHGCKGGSPYRALKYIINNTGIDTEKSYSYKRMQGRCRFKRSSVGATCSNVVKVKKGSETELEQAVALNGPVSVGICAGDTFMKYEKGVYNDPKCCRSLNHAVLVVGYGVNNSGLKYWLVKNSWGPGWGERGYIRMTKDAGNQCGIASSAVFPQV